jgi:ubiquinone/menaquinone biosynthesis C-methylase UbiE
MSYEQEVATHYTADHLLESIEAAVASIGKTTDDVTIDDLAPTDEFHVGSRPATQHLLNQLNFSAEDQILDVGCGLGGAARYMAAEYGCHVTGIDLTQSFIDVGIQLNSWVGMNGGVTLEQASALAMPFEDNAFDGATMLHVGMNIEDKSALFHEIYRVLRPGASFGVYDIMQIKAGDLTYPVPWATESTISKVASPEAYEEAIHQTGFQIDAKTVRLDYALEFFEQIRAKTAANGGPPPFGLHLLMQDSTPIKVKNMIDNFTDGLIAPVEIIVRK